MELTVKQGRREFFRSAGIAGLGAASALAVLKIGEGNAQAQQTQPGFHRDTPAQLFTAALIAEDLATTFYYNALVGKVIQDPALAGPGGTALNPGSSGDANNVSYVRAALGQEFAHAGLLRSLLKIAGPSASPVQTFYFPAATFDNLATDGTTPSFIGTLETLENAFIGAYLTAVRAFAYMAAQTEAHLGNYYVLNGSTLSSDTLAYFSQVSASIMGVECEHRALGRDIADLAPADNLYYESTDGLDGVYNGPNSAVVALTPFLTPSNGAAYQLADAVSNLTDLVLPSTGAPPAF
ncbi:MAG TPA: ferritin-like domain-containing protein [Bryobacteraceae bacterium]|nr:ferritin-like domain-containing protein [Bryobacteraceae bacterium]